MTEKELLEIRNELHRLRLDAACSRVAYASIWAFLTQFHSIPDEAQIMRQALYTMNGTGMIEDAAKAFKVQPDEIRDELGLPSVSESERKIAEWNKGT
jgi:hypothetical protein